MVELRPQVMLETTPAWLEESYARLSFSRHAGGHATPAVQFKNASRPVITQKLTGLIPLCMTHFRENLDF
jgi:hypothetical protein